jgi:hypothetical protein
VTFPAKQFGKQLQVGDFIINDEDVGGDVASKIYRILIGRHGYLPFGVLGLGLKVD